MRSVPAALLAIMGTTIACNTTSEVLPIRTGTLASDSAVYHAQATGPAGNGTAYEVPVTLRVTNTGNQPLELPRCGPVMYRVVQVDPFGRSAFDPAGWDLTCPTDHVRVGVGETYLWEVRLHAPNLVDGITKEPIGVFGGRVHLRIPGVELESEEFVIQVDSAQ